jgi:hypothetical protein
MLGAMGWLPPATPLNFSTWAFVGLVFNYGIRNKYNGWWKSYNYITAAGLDSGLIICTILIFLTLTLTGTDVPQWWGNVKVMETRVSMTWSELLHEVCANIEFRMFFSQPSGRQ